MSKALSVDISATIGKTKTLKLTFTDASDDSAYDVSGNTFELYIKTNNSDAEESAVVSKTDGDFTKATNVATVVLDSDDTDQSEGTLFYYVDMTESGEETRVAYGEITFTYEMTGEQQDSAIQIGDTDLNIALNLINGAVSGGGDFSGPASSTDNAVVRFNGTGGKTGQTSLMTVDDNGTVNIPSGQEYQIDGVAIAGGTFSGPGSSTDNAIVRFDGTGGATGQNSSATVDDNGSINIPSGQAYKIDGTALAASNVGAVATSGNETIAGVKTFNSFPITPSSAPISNYQVANKKYVDDNASGDMLTSTYDPNNVAANVFDVDNHVDGSTNGVYTLTERSKLSGIEESADVTDATNVDAAGAVMDSDFSSNGVMIRTGSGSYTNRTITAGTGISLSNGDGVSGNPTISSNDSAIVHDNLSGFVANEHINHTSVTLTAGTGLTGGGDISSNRTFNVDVGITDDKILQVDDADAADDDYAKFTANGLEGRSYSEVKTDLSLDNVENTAISTWEGSANITTVGTLSSGNADAIVTDASTTAKGKVELATTAETTTGTDATRAVTPDGLKDGYQGSANVTTLGTIGTGTWQGTAIADAYIAESYITATGVTKENLATNGDVETTITDTDDKFPTSGAVVDLAAGRQANIRTDNYTLVIGDRIKHIVMNKATAVTLTIPANASVSFANYTTIPILNIGAGELTIAITTDTLNEADSQFKLAQGRAAYIYKHSSTVWWLVGETNA